MVSFTSLAILCSAVAALASPTALKNATRDDMQPQLFRRETLTSSSEGTIDGTFYSLFIASNTGVTMNILSGQYSLSWSSSAQDVVAGVGFATGSPR
jgi:endo-1,4-beta-xylanase